MKLQNLNSHNNTFINKIRITKYKIQNNNIIQTNDTLFVYSSPPKNPPNTKKSSLLLNHSTTIEKIRHSITKITSSELIILIKKTTNTNKKLTTQKIHSQNKHNNPFIIINYKTITKSLTKNTLFNHQQKTFTKTTNDHNNIFVQTHNKTLFLNELNKLPPNIQTKLLQILKNHTITPIKNNRPQHINVHIITTTNIILNKTIEKKKFRKNLFAQLNK